MRKPIVYIASPYTKGDVAINTHFHCRMFDRLLTDGLVTPIAPLWSHFQHTLFPRPYRDWLAYDHELLPLCDACLRLNASDDKTGYFQSESSGADGEADIFRKMQKPVFFDVESLYEWVQKRNEN